MDFLIPESLQCNVFGQRRPEAVFLFSENKRKKNISRCEKDTEKGMPEIHLVIYFEILKTLEVCFQSIGVPK